MRLRILIVVQIALWYLPISASYAQNKGYFAEPNSILLFSDGVLVLPTVNLAIPNVRNSVPQNPPTLPALSPKGDRVAESVKLPDESGKSNCLLLAPRQAPRYESVLGVYSLQNKAWTLYGRYCFVGSVAFSPDGRKLAFAVKSKSTAPGSSPSSNELMIFDLATNHLTQVPDSQLVVSNAQLSWSPDGRYLVVESFKRGSPLQDIVVIQIGSWTRRVIAEGYSPSWSPKGDWIAYLTEWQQKCILVHPDGTGFRTVLDLKRRFGGWTLRSGLVWSPSGDKLVLNEGQVDGTRREVALYDLATSKITVKSKNGPSVLGWAQEHVR